MTRLNDDYIFPDVYNFHLLCYNLKKVRNTGPEEFVEREFSIFPFWDAKGPQCEYTSLGDVFSSLSAFGSGFSHVPLEEELISLLIIKDPVVKKRMKLVLKTRIPFRIRRFNCKKLKVIKHKRRTKR